MRYSLLIYYLGTTRFWTIGTYLPVRFGSLRTTSVRPSLCLANRKSCARPPLTSSRPENTTKFEPKLGTLKYRTYSQIGIICNNDSALLAIQDSNAGGSIQYR
jgi:hypothetical protein